jgi:hypothetical protein
MNIQTSSGNWVALSGTSVDASGTLGLSGVYSDEKATLVWLAQGNGTLSITAGGYENGVAKAIAVTDGNYYAVTGLDGSASRQTDGTYDVYCTNSGVLYAITPTTGVK